MRRVAAFEARYHRPVFERSQSGYRVLPEAQPILHAMAAVSEAVLATERRIVGADQSPAGRVRIASTDSLCQRVMPDIVSRLSARYPNIELSVFSANVHHDLSRLSADIVVRPTLALGDGLVGQRAGDLLFAVYSDGGPERKWLRLEGALGSSIAARWMSEHVPAERTIGGADSFLVLQHLAALGIGQAILPRIVGDADPRLIRLDMDCRTVAAPVWVACLKEFAATPRFALVQRVLASELSAFFGKGA
jgi:DNA-binding transcriptional LysR family regulator